MAGIAVDRAVITDRGFEHDRRWMLVDTDNRFISQREIHAMALMQIDILEEGLKVAYRLKASSIIIPFEPQTNEFADVTIWEDTCVGQFVSHEADEWFSNMLGFACRLVYMPEQTHRITDPKYTPEGHVTSYADGYPFLLIGQASLDDLNSRLGESLPMNRFRPSIVFTGGEPFIEDLMHTFTIGDIQFHGVKLCARCVMTTINQETIEQGKEPLKTLARYRLKNNKIMFGQNLIHEGFGQITTGQELKVLKLNEEDRFLIT